MCYFKKFERWCKSCSLQDLPATSATVSIYIGGLIQQGISVVILDSNLYAIKWYHDFYFENNPCDNSLYLKNPENPNKKTPQILNLLTSLRSPKTAIIRCKISGAMGSFLQTGLLNNFVQGMFRYHIPELGKSY
jgi:hypothetical protein